MKIKKLIILSLLLIFIFIANIILKPSKTFTYNQVKVIKVYDGDTITIINENNEKEKIRLYGISARELNQEYGQEAKNYLQNLILNKNIDVFVHYKDEYERTVAEIYLDKININQEMVKQGQAFIFHKYNNDLDIYIPLENYAKENQLGMYRNN